MRKNISLLLIEQYGINTVVKYADAGATRQESVLSGLKKVSLANVIIHEAARPFLTVEDYKKLLQDKCENVIFGSSIPFTVIKGHDSV